MSYPDILHHHDAKDWLLPPTPIDARPVDRLRPFQGAETSAKGRSGVDRLSIEFHLDTVKALIATHARIDHVGPIPFWGKEAPKWVKQGRCRLGFEQLLTVDSHQAHLKKVRLLTETARPAIVIAGNGMCSSGRIVNYLIAMLHDLRHNVLFVGYRA
ncbi:hypothetical protein PspS34_20785 [Pseudomonas sp. S34]|jgi:predicted metal-dependent RNase|nr:hypothetical protein PspS34_20785 [Pseudomonas sp. S34]